MPIEANLENLARRRAGEGRRTAGEREGEEHVAQIQEGVVAPHLEAPTLARGCGVQDAQCCQSHASCSGSCIHRRADLRIAATRHRITHHA
eukprot:scaffold21017_cov104-Isochrysis_galbana.AAC.2